MAGVAGPLSCILMSSKSQNNRFISLIPIFKKKRNYKLPPVFNDIASISTII